MTASDKGTTQGRPADTIRDQLAVFLGPFTARTAMRTFAKKEFGTEPETLTLEQVPRLLEALGPALRTLLGTASAERLVQQIRKDLAL